MLTKAQLNAAIETADQYAELTPCNSKEADRAEKVRGLVAVEKLLLSGLEGDIFLRVGQQRKELHGALKADVERAGRLDGSFRLGQLNGEWLVPG